MPRKTIAILFLAVGTVVVLGVALSAAGRHRFVQHAQRAEAVVVQVYSGPFHPEFEFETAAGERIRFIQNGFHKGYGVGAKAEVLYDANDPANAVVDGFGALWAFHLIFGTLGLVFMAVGGVQLKYSRFFMLAAALAFTSCLAPKHAAEGPAMRRIDSFTTDLEIGGEGGTATFHTKDGALIRIETLHYGETFRSERDYRLEGEDGGLTYMLERLHRYNRPIYYDAAVARENQDEEAFDEGKGTVMRYHHHFENGKLVRRSDDTGDPEDETQYERIGEAILEELEALKAMRGR